MGPWLRHGPPRARRLIRFLARSVCGTVAVRGGRGCRWQAGEHYQQAGMVAQPAGAGRISQPTVVGQGVVGAGEAGHREGGVAVVGGGGRLAGASREGPRSLTRRAQLCQVRPTSWR